MATATGWTLCEISQLTLWDINELFEYWQEYPPTHVLVAAYLMHGKRTSTSKGRHAAAGSMDELIQAVSGSGGNVGNKLPPVYRA
jgi:hypothetical protein